MVLDSMDKYAQEYFLEHLVAYTGTHDNNTLLGFIWELDNYTRNVVLDYVGYSADDWNKCLQRLTRVAING